MSLFKGLSNVFNAIHEAWEGGTQVHKAASAAKLVKTFTGLGVLGGAALLTAGLSHVRSTRVNKTETVTTTAVTDNTRVDSVETTNPSASVEGISTSDRVEYATSDCTSLSSSNPLSITFNSYDRPQVENSSYNRQILYDREGKPLLGPVNNRYYYLTSAGEIINPNPTSLIQNPEPVRAIEPGSARSSSANMPLISLPGPSRSGEATPSTSFKSFSDANGSQNAPSNSQSRITDYDPARTGSSEIGDTDSELSLATTGSDASFTTLGSSRASAYRYKLAKKVYSGEDKAFLRKLLPPDTVINDSHSVLKDLKFNKILRSENQNPDGTVWEPTKYYAIKSFQDNPDHVLVTKSGCFDGISRCKKWALSRFS